MVAVDRYFGKQTVKDSTLKIVARVWTNHRQHSVAALWQRGIERLIVR